MALVKASCMKGEGPTIKRSIFGNSFAVITGVAALLVMFILGVGMNSHISSAKEQIIRTDVAEAAEGCTIVGIRGKYITNAKKVISRINAIRYEACVEGVINPDSGKPLTSGDYVPVKWSTELERIARIRAAEAIIKASHERPDGQNCFNVKSEYEFKSVSENLAWNYSKDVLYGIEQWYEEKSDWVNRTNGVTGHYTSIIDPTNTYFGMGVFMSSYGSWPASVCARFGAVPAEGTVLDETPMEGVDDCIQLVEVRNNMLGDSKIVPVGNTNTTTLKKGADCQYFLSVEVKNGSAVSLSQYIGNVSWSVSDTDIATVDNEGVVTAVKDGTVTLKAVADTGIAASCRISVSDAKTDTNVSDRADSSYNEAVSNPKRTKILKIKAAKKRITVKWKKIKGVSGYQVRYASKKNGKGAEYINVKGNGNAVKIYGLKKGKRYYFSVRTYITASGEKLYSGWSKIKRVH